MNFIKVLFLNEVSNQLVIASNDCWYELNG